MSQNQGPGGGERNVPGHFTGYLSYEAIVLWRNCPWGSCQQGKCPGAVVPGAIVIGRRPYSENQCLKAFKAFPPLTRLCSIIPGRLVKGQFNNLLIWDILNCMQQIMKLTKVSETPNTTPNKPITRD